MKLARKPWRADWDSFQVLGLIGSIALIAAAVFPFDSFKIPLCSFRWVTGVPCPTCGMTTCFRLMMHGHALAAARVSPLGLLVFLVTVLAVLDLAWTRLLRYPAWRLELSRREKIGAGLLLAGMLAANWIYNVLTM